MVAARIAFWITRPFISFGYDRVRTTKKVIAPMGFTIAKSATKVVMAKLTRSAAIPARPRQRPVLEGVEHFSRERQIPGVAKWRERRVGPRLVRDDLPLDNLDASDLHERPGPEGLDRPVAHLDDHVARFQVAIPDDGWRVLRADDLGPSTDGLDLVSDGGRQDEERPVADPPPAADGPT